ncbi:MYB DNA-binding-like protein [Alternaria alternata]|nr:MYB DNA-binding-like protein [Alternaria alternata]
MEPRLHALRDMSSQSSMPFITEAPNMSSSGSQRPSHHPDHSFVRPKSLMLANTSPENAQFNDVRRDGQERSHPTRSMPSAPIAQVLNNEANVLGAAQPVPSTFASSTTPFSGRLVDLLLDSPDHARQKWDHEHQFLQPENAGSSPSVIKLPRLPQPPKRTAKRPRIPPLLQGLHQPPPLPPEGRLFPPITGEKNAFAGERGYDARFEESRNKDVDEHAFLEGSALDYSRTTQNSDHPLVAQVAAQPNAPDVAHETNVATNNSISTQAPTQTKRGKKRNKWSEQETKDLLVGVSRYGIGNWKKILQDPDFGFNNRTAVDLKDRFRVCCPGEGLKPRQPKTKGKEKVDLENTAFDLPNQAIYTHQHSLPVGEHNNDNNLVSNPPSPSETQQRVATRNKATTHLDLAELGIHEPFSKATRRPRRAFSQRDDVNLLKGFEKYGSVWHLMRDDEDLDFGSRHPTDLRDRFRIRYPDKYAKAGYKLKAKEKERTLSKQTHVPEQERQDGPSQLEQAILDHNTSQHAKTSHAQQDMTTAAKDMHPFHNISNTNTSSHFATSSSNTSNPNSALKPFNSSSYLSDPLPTLPFNEADPDLTQDMATAGDESPITLSRNILRWADANPSSLYAFTPAVSSSSSLTTAGNVHGGGHGSKGEGGAGVGLNGYVGGVGGQQQQQQQQMEGGRGTVLPEADSWLLGGERVQAFGMYKYRS